MNTYTNKYTDDEKVRMVADVECGMSLSACAKKHGCSRTTVTKAVQKSRDSLIRLPPNARTSDAAYYYWIDSFFKVGVRDMVFRLIDSEWIRSSIERRTIERYGKPLE